MAYEIEEFDKEKPQDSEIPPAEERDHSWLENIVEHIEEEAHTMDDDFPLSGGEGEHVVHRKHKDDEDTHKKSSFLDDLDTDFPLSGGEV